MRLIREFKTREWNLMCGKRLNKKFRSIQEALLPFIYAISVAFIDFSEPSHGLIHFTLILIRKICFSWQNYAGGELSL